LLALTPSTVEHFSLDHLGTPRVMTDLNVLPFGEGRMLGRFETDSRGGQEGAGLGCTKHRDGGFTD
jgi:hypothetical protein